MTNLLLNRRGFLRSGTATALAAATVFRPGRAQAKTALKLSHQLGTSHPAYQAAERMVAAVAERTSGEVSISIFANSALGSPPETVKQTQLGAIDLVMFNPPNIESQDSSAGVIQIPYQFDGYEHVHRVLGDTGKDFLLRFFERNGLTWVANFEYGFRALSNSRRPVNTPEDVAGLKLRVPPELSIKATFDALGANTQTIALAELYLALSSGAVDGQDNPVAVTYANNFYEVQKHIALTRHIYTSFMLAANPRSWDGLADDHRAILLEEAIKAGAEAQRDVVAGEKEVLAAMEAKGVAVTYPEPAPFRALMQPAWDTLKARIGDATWEEWMACVEAARTA